VKADISRQTFDSNKRYSGVLMQQGRVQLDSEWNEQQEIHQHRTQAGTRGVIGPSGTPIGESGRATGFEITAREGRLCLGAGHIYVDGVLCDNDIEREVSYAGLPDPPDPADLAGWMEDDEEDGGRVRLGLVYLDVWERHITHFDDALIREVALGGPDTTTRKQTVWQVKIMKLDAEDDDDVDDDDIALLGEYAELRAVSQPDESEAEKLKEIALRPAKILGGLCERSEKALDKLREPPTGKLGVRAKEEDGASGPCQIPPGGGYTRLENQLYRVEIHEPGNRGTARFKWSRDNGSVVTGIEGIDAEKKEIIVRDTGRDEFLRLASDQWVEVVDDRTELQGRPRDLLQIDDVDHARRIVTVKQTPPAFDDLRPHHPKLRRWDQSGDGATEEGVGLDKQELGNDGIEVEFGSGMYRTGDYWLIPARTATGDVEWPLEDPEDPSSGPEALPPHGVRHGLCALAIVAAVPEDDSDENPEGSRTRLVALHDCRSAYPRLTKLAGFFYLGGDGQEAMPGRELREPLRVGVANGQWPVEGARVRFETENGSLKNEDGSPGRDGDGNPDDKSVVVLTSADGIAACRWTLDGANQSQRVTARLLDVEDEDDAGEGTLHLPIHFAANLSVAGEVGYTPGDACKNLVGVTTVQEALDELCKTGDNVQGIVIEDVRTIEPDASLPNDARVPAPLLARGLRVVCDTPVDPDSVGGKPTCFVTLDMPFPLSEADRELWGTGDLIVGYRPLILKGNVTVEEESVLWTPADERTREWLSDVLFATLGERFPEVPAILVHLTLKGNFIWSREDRLLLLDGEAFGVPRTGEDPTGLDLPSGDLRRGGDFEMWFWLEPEVTDVELESVTLERSTVVGGENTTGSARLIWRGMGVIGVESMTLDQTTVTGGENVSGSIRLSGAAPQGGVTVRLESDDPSVLFDNGQGRIDVRVEAGDQDAPFSIETTPVAESRDVTISARLVESSNETPKTTTLTVQAPRPLSLALNPPIIGVGETSRGVVFLSGPAPEDGITLDVRSSNPTVFVPAEGVPVESGDTAAAFDINDEGLVTVKPRFADIRVAYEGDSVTARLTVSPIDKSGDKVRDKVTDKVTDKVAKDREEFPTEFSTRGGDPTSAIRPDEAPNLRSTGGEAFIRPEERPEV
jgi:hypothetical protein